ncbi:MAG: Der GTPase-activating protein YihI [Candidatus Celerinatantimonas neptuna]|nr:MAG: Der GTPase-activating protein YihI [Candidatus Celerinatantimonas neptuna]
MAYKKKNRKGGLLAPRKTVDFKSDRVLPADAVKKGKGRKSGSRQQPANVTRASTNSGHDFHLSDPRLGSKKPVQLVSAKPSQQEHTVSQKLSDEVKEAKQDELSRLEQDPRLMTLLDRSDEGEELTTDEQQWLENSLNRIGQLMDELGLHDDEDEDESELDSDDWDQFDSGDLDELLDPDERS